MEDQKLKDLIEEVSFRDTQLNLLHDLLIKSQTFLYPVLHLFGLSGTGKTYTTRKFLKKFTNQPPPTGKKTTSTENRIHVYLNCSELCYASVSLLFNEIMIQIANALPSTAEKDNNNQEEMDINMEIQEETPLAELSTMAIDENDDESIADVRMNDCTSFLRQLKRTFERNKKKTFLYIVFDNADSLKYFTESGNLLLTLCKLNEYVNMGEMNSKINISSIFISEIDWHSLISDCDLMCRTESARPFVIYFNDYTKEQMNQILKKTALSLISMQEAYKQTKPSRKSKISNNHSEVEFYTKIILDVFFPICKDLNEIQYLIQIYYDQLLNSMNQTDLSDKDDYEKMMIAWNKMKPFLKQALTQIYLRQSMFTPQPKDIQASKKLASPDEFLSLEFESLNMQTGEKNFLKESLIDSTRTTIPLSFNQLPKLLKYLLISSYIATHNPAKYDKKLFDYNTTGKSRKSRFTAQKFQQNEENQRQAALKTQTFDVNRLLAIFFAICSENGYSHVINLSQIQLNLKTLKSLHYLQQSNSAYSSLDEPKYKCLIDFDTIFNLASSVNFNIKQYLVEYITI